MVFRRLPRAIVRGVLLSLLASGGMAAAQSFGDAPVGGEPLYGTPDESDDVPVGGAPIYDEGPMFDPPVGGAPVYDEGPMFDPPIGGAPIGGPAVGDDDGPVGDEPVY